MKCSACGQTVPDRDMPFVVVRETGRGCRSCVKVSKWMRDNYIIHKKVDKPYRAQAYIEEDKIHLEPGMGSDKESIDYFIECSVCGIEYESSEAVWHAFFVHKNLVEKQMVHYEKRVVGFDDNNITKMCLIGGGILSDEEWLCDCPDCLDNIRKIEEANK